MSAIGREQTDRFAAAKTHMRSFAASFGLPTFYHSFMLAAEEVLSLCPARSPVSFPKKDAVLRKPRPNSLALCLECRRRVASR